MDSFARKRTTKILVIVDALGNLVRFVLIPANRYDTVGVAPLIKGVEFGAMLTPSHRIAAQYDERAMDKAFDKAFRP